MLAITRLKPRPSGLCAAYLLLMHLLPMTLVWILFHARWQFYGCSILCLTSLVFLSAKHLFFLAPTAITQLWNEADGSWLLLLKNGKVITARLLGDSLIIRYLIILNFKSIKNGKVYNVLFWPDTFSTANFRKLRVELLMGKICREE